MSSFRWSAKIAGNFFTEMLNFKIYRIMEEFFNLFEKDMMSEGLSKFELVMIAIVAPFLFVLVCILVNLLP